MPRHLERPSPDAAAGGGGGFNGTSAARAEVVGAGQGGVHGVAVINVIAAPIVSGAS